MSVLEVESHSCLHSDGRPSLGRDRALIRKITDALVLSYTRLQTDSPDARDLLESPAGPDQIFTRARITNTLRQRRGKRRERFATRAITSPSA